MSTTVGTLEKKVETVFENLTPAEKAKYVYDESWRIADRQSKGIDEETHQQEIERFFHRHVATLSAAGFIEYLIAEETLNTNKWSWMYFYKVLWYQDLVCALLGQIIHHIEIQKEMTENPKLIKQPDKMIEVFDSEIKTLSKWREEYRQEINMLLKEVPWEKMNESPPGYPWFDLPKRALIAEDNKPKRQAMTGKITPNF